MRFLLLMSVASLLAADTAPNLQITDRQQLELERIQRRALQLQLELQQLEKEYDKHMEALKSACAAAHAELKQSTSGDWSCQASATAAH